MTKYMINHLMPGRIRLTVPALKESNECNYMEEMLRTVKGVKTVRVVPLIQSVVVEFDEAVIHYKQILQSVSFLIQQPKTDFQNDKVRSDLKNSIIRSGISGLLLVAATLRKASPLRPDAFDYMVVIATSYTVLSHGGEGNLSHPDVVTGAVSMLSLGNKNIIHVSWVTWLVNLLEIINDWQNNSYLLFSQ